MERLGLQQDHRMTTPSHRKVAVVNKFFPAVLFHIVDPKIVVQNVVQATSVNVHLSLIRIRNDAHAGVKITSRGRWVRTIRRIEPGQQFPRSSRRGNGEFPRIVERCPALAASAEHNMDILSHALRKRDHGMKPTSVRAFYHRRRIARLSNECFFERKGLPLFACRTECP